MMLKHPQVAFYFFKINNTILLAMVAFVLCSAPVFAQTTNNDNLQKEFEKTFQTMLTDPSDVDVTLKYANLAIELKDYESAIPALERILMFNPKLAKVKQDLGILYFKLESYEMAQSYLEDAIKTKDVSTEVVKTSNTWIQKIKKRRP